MAPHRHYSRSRVEWLSRGPDTPSLKLKRATATGAMSLMGIQLKRDDVTLLIHEPGELYQGSRFDWTGTIGALTFAGVPVTTDETVVGFNPRLQGRGFYNEFSFTSPPGFDEIRVGERFHKIGVGYVTKSHATYSSLSESEFTPLMFSFEHNADSCTVATEGTELNGYAYRLRKHIELGSAGFTIAYELENTGHKPIRTHEYAHNFLALGHRGPEPGYRLEFDFDLETERLEEMVDPESSVVLSSKAVRFSAPRNTPFFYTNLCEGRSVPAGWRLEHDEERIGIREHGDFRSSRVNLWGWGHVVSPELYLGFDVPPGDSFSWTRSYELYTL